MFERIRIETEDRGNVIEEATSTRGVAILKELFGRKSIASCYVTDM